VAMDVTVNYHLFWQDSQSSDYCVLSSKNEAINFRLLNMIQGS